MAFDEEDLDPHGECANEINRLKDALGFVGRFIKGEKIERELVETESPVTLGEWIELARNPKR